MESLENRWKYADSAAQTATGGTGEPSRRYPSPLPFGDT
jgi:hypothetical protein